MKNLSEHSGIRRKKIDFRRNPSCFCNLILNKKMALIKMDMKKGMLTAFAFLTGMTLLAQGV
jgi:hypothetical protein